MRRLLLSEDLEACREQNASLLNGDPKSPERPLMLAGKPWLRNSKRRPMVERFWEKVDKRGENDCWLWMATKDKKGYGRINTPHRIPVLAHRYSMMLHLKREIPSDIWVLHNCPGGDNSSCVNPRHLWLGDALDNNRDMIAKGRFKHHGGFPGESNGFAKLTDRKIRKIRWLSSRGWNNCRIGRRFHLHPSTVRSIVLRETWKHVP